MDKHILPPDHVKERPCFDLQSIALSSGESLSALTDQEVDDLCHVDLLKGFPKLPKSGMDDSQLAACERMLTKSLAIVQVGSSTIYVMATSLLRLNTKPSSSKLTLYLVDRAHPVLVRRLLLSKFLKSC